MPVYKEMDPEEVERLLKPYRDAGEDTLLRDEKKKQDAYYRNQSCPTCKATNMTPYFLGVAHAYGANEILPRSGLRCERCGGCYDPHSNLVISPGSWSRVAEAAQAGDLPGLGVDEVNSG